MTIPSTYDRVHKLLGSEILFFSAHIFTVVAKTLKVSRLFHVFHVNITLNTPVDCTTHFRIEKNSSVVCDSICNVATCSIYGASALKQVSILALRYVAINLLQFSYFEHKALDVHINCCYYNTSTQYDGRKLIRIAKTSCHDLLPD